jgi:IclR family KDG regulon transcriptional repressor
MLAYLGPAERDCVIARQSFQRYDKTLRDRPALLADFKQIRTRGFAFDDEEHEPSIHCVGVPIRSKAGAVIGAISATTTIFFHDLQTLESFVPDLRTAAGRIAQDAEIQFLDRPPRADAGAG